MNRLSESTPTASGCTFMLYIVYYLCCTIANSSVKDVVLWFQVNGLSVNLDKTCYSIFGHSDVSDSLELKIGTTVLKRVTTCKYLGIIIDDKVSWNDHIDYVYKKLPNLLVYSTVYVIDYLVNY